MDKFMEERRMYILRLRLASLMGWNPEGPLGRRLLDRALSRM